MRSRRGAGPCSKCGVNPKYVAPGGQKYSWCYECRAAGKRAYTKRRREREQMELAWAGDYHSVCPNCQLRERKVAKSGSVYHWCAECLRAYDNARNAVRRAGGGYEERRLAGTRALVDAKRVAYGQEPLGLLDVSPPTPPTPPAPTQPQPTPERARVRVDDQDAILDVIAGMMSLIERARSASRNAPKLQLDLALRTGPEIIRMSVERTDIGEIEAY